MKNNALAGKTIVITGASSGVGRAAALEFAPYDVKLVLAARNEVALDELAGECGVLGSDALVVVTDVTDPKALINLVNAANDWQGKIDVWINNAGVLAAGEFDKTPIEVHAQVIETNMLGYINGTHAVMPVFKKQQKGILINNISIGGFLPVPYGAGYTASKFGLRGFSEAIKAELSSWPDIHICDLFPAFLDTPGIVHAANYTEKALKPAPPVYDPRRVARAMVKITLNPRSNTYVGSASSLLKLSHNLFPQLTAKITGSVMRRYFKSADPMVSTNGNLFNTVNYGMSAIGSFGRPGKPGAHHKYLALGVLAGLAAGVYLLNSKK
ncbi:SDR family oxidoreductase [Mucilaginibacter sabulilitoris]|uniref:SDR family oxidoreductase n=1 Tax=Mucilaginibacter sabulilitoris TaxID=1173583 RepID=A0ABZ0TGW8_9SPHI|nr:SDR family oxidoreductase [Mucilaginibacter sabulilitoris]WPU91448.1 SDR family oxidoreductase [Mucilaginibacter sabulilitoris]